MPTLAVNSVRHIPAPPVRAPLSLVLCPLSFGVSDPPLAVPPGSRLALPFKGPRTKDEGQSGRGGVMPDDAPAVKPDCAARWGGVPGPAETARPSRPS